MTVLFVVGGLVALLALACWWEARRGKPAWGAHLDSSAPTAGDASRSAKSGLAPTLGATGLAVGDDGGGHG